MGMVCPASQTTYPLLLCELLTSTPDLVNKDWNSRDKTALGGLRPDSSVLGQPFLLVLSALWQSDFPLNLVALIPHWPVLVLPSDIEGPRMLWASLLWNMKVSSPHHCVRVGFNSRASLPLWPLYLVSSVCCLWGLFTLFPSSLGIMSLRESSPCVGLSLTAPDFNHLCVSTVQSTQKSDAASSLMPQNKLECCLCCRHLMFQAFVACGTTNEIYKLQMKMPRRGRMVGGNHCFRPRTCHKMLCRGRKHWV